MEELEALSRLYQEDHYALSASQHFVPRWYFRHFSGQGPDIISLLKISDGSVHHNAPFKSQCCRKHFYGPPAFEKGTLKVLEDRQRKTLLNLMNYVARDSNVMPLITEIVWACMFQRHRVESIIKKQKISKT